MQIQENACLQERNTFGVKARADYLTEVYSIDQLQRAINYSKSLGIPFLVLGEGSNILFTKDFPGLIIVLKFAGISEERVDANHVSITAQAGENWHQFVLYCIDKNYGGLENLSLIPGNVGSAPIQNIGAYGTEIKDTFRSCKVLDVEDFSCKVLGVEECNFGYRDSIFKSAQRGRYIILEVTFLLTTCEHALSMSYEVVQQDLAKRNILRPTIKDVSDAIIAIRKSKIPDPAVKGNAGSFFKNPVLSQTRIQELRSRFSNMPCYPSGEAGKISAGWLIEQCGWKGRVVGNVGCHEKQALVIINETGNASGMEIFHFAQKIIESVKEKFGIELEIEVNVL